MLSGVSHVSDMHFASLLFFAVYAAFDDDCAFDHPVLVTNSS